MTTFTRELEPVELADAVRYAGAAGDLNPIHYDRALAQRNGHPDTFAQGMLTAGLLGVVVGEQFGPERVRRLGVRFRSPLWRGAAPTVSGQVTVVVDGVARVELSVTADGKEVLSGWAEIAQ